jgi:geranylgeranyl diphosphate synthase, type II
MFTSEQLLEKIKSALTEVEYTGQPQELYKPISYTLDLGGKRIRPVMVLMSCDMFGGNVDMAINSAIAIEVFHNFTLLHDDIMDNAAIRRGKPTVFKKWNANVAILSGDTMFAIAYKHLAKSDNKVLQNVLSIFTTAAIEVCEGQQFDMNYETIEKVSIPEYIEMIRLKTGVLIAASLKTGAVVAGASKEDVDNIYKFGECVGLAFQLKDDLLDVYGEEDTFGKQIGGDIMTNKKTFLYIKALQEAKGDDLALLKKYFAVTDADRTEKVKSVTEIYDRLKVKEATIDLINEYYIRAQFYFDALTIDPSRKTVLKKYSDDLMNRDF